MLGVHLNWLVKIKLRGPGLLDQLLLYAYTVVREDAKETETEEAIVSFVTFLSLVAIRLGGEGAGLPGPPLWLRLWPNYCIYHTQWKLYTVPLIVERQAGKL